MPASLVAVIVGVVAVKALSLDDHGVAIVGPIKSGLPSVGLPDVNTADFGDLIGPSLGVMLVGFAEGLGAAKTYARATTTRSTPTASCSASGRGMSPPAWRAA